MSAEWLQELCPEIAEWQIEIIAEHIERVRASEREACAKVADEYWVFGMSSSYIADAIRARGRT